MTTKSYLEQLWNIDTRIIDKINEANRWKEIAYSKSYGSSKGASQDMVKSSHNPDRVIDAIIKSVDYQREAEQMSKDMVELKHTIEKQIGSLENDSYYNVLHAYYIDEKSFNDISIETHYSTKSVKRRYEAAIKCFEELYGETYLKSCPLVSMFG